MLGVMATRTELGVGDSLGPYPNRGAAGEERRPSCFRAREPGGDVVALKAAEQRLGDDETFPCALRPRGPGGRDTSSTTTSCPVLDAEKRPVRASSSRATWQADRSRIGFAPKGARARGGPEARAEIGTGLDALHREGLVTVTSSRRT